MLKHLESGIAGKELGFNHLVWIKKIANQFQIKGTVFTKSDGSIKIIAEGDEKNLIEFAKILKNRNTGHAIENFYVKLSEPVEDLGNFLIAN